MRRHLSDDRQRRGLLLWVIFSSGLTTRDLWLAGHGGGATPSWLLRAETAAFSLSAVSGLAALRTQSRATDRAGSKALKTTTAAAGAAAVVMHGVRLAIYLRARVANSVRSESIEKERASRRVAPEIAEKSQVASPAASGWIGS